MASVTSSGSAIREGDPRPPATEAAEGRSADGARWHLLLDSAPAALLLLRRAGPFRRSPTIGVANRAFGELAGVAAEALAGRGVRALRDVVEPDGRFADLLAAAEAGEPFAGQLGLRAGGGRVLNVDARGQEVPLGEQPEGYAVWLAPGPAAPSAGAATEGAPGDGLRLLAGLGRECVYELAVGVDCRLRLSWADPRLAELAGYEPDELQALGGFFGLVAAADADELHRRNQRLLAGDTTGPVRYRLRRKSGESR